jgi:putative Holliday junction resolvase
VSSSKNTFNIRGARILCLDIGAKRVGMAVSDPLGITAQGIGTVVIENPHTLPAQIQEVAAQYNVETLIVGLPLHLNGTEGEGARNARKIAKILGEKLGLPVILWDERLTTVQAERAMKSAGLSRKKRAKRVDSIAAQLILQAYLDSGNIPGKEQS